MAGLALVLGFLNKWDVWSSSVGGWWIKVVLGVVGSVAAGPARGRGPSGRATILGELSH